MPPTPRTSAARPARPAWQPGSRLGLSLVEVAVSTLLVGVVLVGALRGVGGVLTTWSTAEQRHDGLGVAQQLMAEILQQPYADPNAVPLLGLELLESGSNRATWDDVDDYHGWSRSPQDKSGNPLAGFSGWTCAVTVQHANVANPQNVGGADQGLKRITVTVTDPRGRTTTLVAYRSPWGMLEAAPSADATLVTWVGSEIRPTGAMALHSGVNLQNHAEDR